jgi:hypothetical protein
MVANHDENIERKFEQSLPGFGFAGKHGLLHDHKAQLAPDVGKVLENYVTHNGSTRPAGTLHAIASAQATQVNTTQNHNNVNPHDLAMNMEDFSGNKF